MPCMLCLASGQYRQAATCYGLCTHPTQTSLKREVQCKLPECYDYSSSSTLMPNTFTLTNAAAPHPTPPHPPVGHHGSEGWQQQPGPWPASQGWLQPHAGPPSHHAGGRGGGSETPQAARGRECECAVCWATALETPAGSDLLSAAATKCVTSRESSHEGYKPPECSISLQYRCFSAAKLYCRLYGPASDCGAFL